MSSRQRPAAAATRQARRQLQEQLAQERAASVARLREEQQRRDG